MTLAEFKINIDYVEKLGSPIYYSDRTEHTFLTRAGMGKAFLSALAAADQANGSPEGRYNDDASSVQCGVYDTVKAVFGGQSSSSTSDGTGVTYSADNSPIARDIRLHPNFCCYWKYNLYQFCPALQRGSFTTVLPPWHTTMKKPEDIPPAQLKEYRWAESRPGATETGEWILIASRDIQADTYPYPAIVVHETVDKESYSDAIKSVQKSGICAAPGKTFGETKDDSYWQIIGSRVEQTGKKEFKTVTDYQFCPDGWDGRIIPGGL